MESSIKYRQSGRKTNKKSRNQKSVCKTKLSTEIKFFKQTLTDTQTMAKETTEEVNFVYNQIYLKCWMIETGYHHLKIEILLIPILKLFLIKTIPKWKLHSWPPAHSNNAVWREWRKLGFGLFCHFNVTPWEPTTYSLVTLLFL